MSKAQKNARARAIFTLDADVLSDLQEVVTQMKRKARAAGKLLPSMSSVAQTALEAEIKRLRKTMKRSG